MVPGDVEGIIEDHLTRYYLRRERPSLARMLERKPPMLAASALANKMARGIWAMLMRGEDCRGPEIGSAA